MFRTRLKHSDDDVCTARGQYSALSLSQPIARFEVAKHNSSSLSKRTMLADLDAVCRAWRALLTIANAENQKKTSLKNPL
jgi:hypothetical protein